MQWLRELLSLHSQKVLRGTAIKPDFVNYMEVNNFKLPFQLRQSMLKLVKNFCCIVPVNSYFRHWRSTCRVMNVIGRVTLITALKTIYSLFDYLLLLELFCKSSKP